MGEPRTRVVLEAGGLAPVRLGSEFVVAFIIVAVLYVGSGEVESCIDQNGFGKMAKDAKEMRLQIGK